MFLNIARELVFITLRYLVHFASAIAILMGVQNLHEPPLFTAANPKSGNLRINWFSALQACTHFFSEAIF